MANGTCPECKQPVAEGAATCPECGFPLRQPQAAPKGVAFARTGTCVALSGLVGLVAGAWEAGLASALLGLCLGALAGWWFVRLVGHGFLPGLNPLYQFRARDVSGAVGEGVLCAILGPLVVAVLFGIGSAREGQGPGGSPFGSSRHHPTHLRSPSAAGPSVTAQKKAQAASATAVYWQEAVVRRENALEMAENAILQQAMTPASYFVQLLATFRQESDRVRALPTVSVDPELLTLVRTHLNADARLAGYYEALARATRGSGANRVLNAQLLTNEDLKQFQAWLDNPPPELRATLRGLSAETEQLNERPVELREMRGKLEGKYGLQLRLPDHAVGPE